MHPLERISRLEDVIKNLEDIGDLYPEFSILWGYVNQDYFDPNAVNFHIKLAMSIGILKNQVQHEMGLLNVQDNDPKLIQ